MKINNIRVMYLRDKSGHIDGCLAIRLNAGGNYAEYQFSVLNPADRFDRAHARALAKGRLLEKPYVVTLPKNPNMHVISEEVMRDVSNHKDAPARARKAARFWLRSNGLN